MTDCWDDLRLRDQQPLRQKGISPLLPPEEFVWQIYTQKREQIEAYRETDLDVPWHLIEECEEWRQKWIAKAYQEIGLVGPRKID